MVPYVLWALIYAKISFKNLLLIAYGTNETIISAGSSGVLWFLPVYFVATILFEIVMYVSKKNKMYSCYSQCNYVFNFVIFDV